MRKISLALAFVASLLALPAEAANFTAKDASAATIIFTNPGNCTTGCTPIFSWSDSTGANLVAVLTAGADGASNTANGGLTYSRNMVFNGTTWDRWLGDATNGGFVNVKTSVLPTGAATSALQSSAAAAKGEGATGAAVPSGAQYVGLNAAGNLTGWTAKAGNTYAATDVVPGVAVVNTQVSVTPGDGITTTIYGTAPASPTIGSDLLFNGTSYDRQRSGGVTGMAGVNLQATPSGGATTFKLIGAASNNSTLIGSAGVHTVYSYQTSSISASTPYWLKFYDKATAPTCGTDTPVKVILIPPTNSGNNGNIPVGFSVALGLGICVVGGIADNDNTSIAATTVAVNVDYK